VTDILVITGMSGAGRSQAAAVLEDLGWYVVDNLPTSLVGKIADLASAPGSGISRLALVVGGRQHLELLPEVESLRAAGHRVRILHLDASTPELVRRYEATRRRHPFADEAGGVLEAIEAERAEVEVVKAEADRVIDTTDLNVHQLKTKLVGAFEDDAPAGRMQLAIESFGFKHGLPLDADVVFDVRFLPNPHWVDELRPLTGLEEPVIRYVLDQHETGPFLDSFEELLVSLLPAYAAEGKSYLTIAIGCTGGRHRSVAVGEELARRLGTHGHPASVTHRDIGR
jgi:UPF0042 nucleotide-binding protein